MNYNRFSKEWQNKLKPFLKAIDLRAYTPSEEAKAKLLEFIKKASGITDEVLPEVPKGILKI